MSTKKKGVVTTAKEWWKHLRWTKRQFWKAERKAAKRGISQRITEHREP